jgi:hypothetical protein
MISKTYSFLDVQASIAGPGGSFMLSEGGIADEGITIQTEERVTTQYGADGEWMHSLKAAKGGRVIIRVMRTGALNSMLSRLFAYDSTSAANCGQNLISVRDPQRGDWWTVQGAALVKHPDESLGSEGKIVEWQFNAGSIDGEYGTGSPSTTI